MTTLAGRARAARLAESHYQTLGVPNGANQEQIKAAYRRRALRLHPDKRPDDVEAGERFKRCSEAYAALSSRERRAAYDAALLLEGGAGEIVGGLVSDLLGGRFRRRKRGRDLQYSLELSVEDVSASIDRTIEFYVDEPCAACGTSGAANGGQRPCEDCRGRGLQPKEGLISLPQPCTGCGGSGQRPVRPCGACDGVGMVERRREYRVSLPRGTRDGELKVVPGQGEPGFAGGNSGDLHLRIKVQRHPLFVRDGRDLRLTLPLSFTSAALGGSVVVPVPGGEVRMRVPAGSQSGAVFRVRGKGVSAGGDLLVELAVETPNCRESEARQLLERLEELCGAENYPRVQGFEAARQKLRAAREARAAAATAQGAMTVVRRGQG